MGLLEEVDELNKKYDNMNRLQKIIYNIKEWIYIKYLLWKYRKL